MTSVTLADTFLNSGFREASSRAPIDLPSTILAARSWRRSRRSNVLAADCNSFDKEHSDSSGNERGAHVWPDKPRHMSAR